MTTRHAFVLGLQDYAIGKLEKPISDTTALQQVLVSLGFKVALHHNLKNKQDIELELNKFLKEVEADKEVGCVLFYYAGHGFMIQGKNFIVPLEVESKTVQERITSMVPLNDVLTKIYNSCNQAPILFFFDACRNEPLSVEQIRQLSDTTSMQQDRAIKGSVVCYATSPSFKTKDTVDSSLVKHSPFAHALIKYLPEQENIQDICTHIAKEVHELTKGEQVVTWESNLLYKVFLAGGLASVNTKNIPQSHIDAVKNATSFMLLLRAMEKFPTDYNLLKYYAFHAQERAEAKIEEMHDAKNVEYISSLVIKLFDQAKKNEAIIDTFAHVFNIVYHFQNEEIVQLFDIPNHYMFINIFLYAMKAKTSKVSAISIRTHIVAARLLAEYFSKFENYDKYVTEELLNSVFEKLHELRNVSSNSTFDDMQLAKLLIKSLFLFFYDTTNHSRLGNTLYQTLWALIKRFPSYTGCVYSILCLLNVLAANTKVAPKLWNSVESIQGIITTSGGEPMILQAATLFCFNMAMTVSVSKCAPLVPSIVQCVLMNENFAVQSNTQLISTAIGFVSKIVENDDFTELPFKQICINLFECLNLTEDYENVAKIALLIHAIMKRHKLEFDNMAVPPLVKMLEQCLASNTILENQRALYLVLLYLLQQNPTCVSPTSLSMTERGVVNVGPYDGFYSIMLQLCQLHVSLATKLTVAEKMLKLCRNAINMYDSLLLSDVEGIASCCIIIAILESKPQDQIAFCFKKLLLPMAEQKKQVSDSAKAAIVSLFCQISSNVESKSTYNKDMQTVLNAIIIGPQPLDQALSLQTCNLFGTLLSSNLPYMKFIVGSSAKTVLFLMETNGIQDLAPYFAVLQACCAISESVEKTLLLNDLDKKLFKRLQNRNYANDVYEFLSTTMTKNLAARDAMVSRKTLLPFMCLAAQEQTDASKTFLATVVTKIAQTNKTAEYMKTTQKDSASSKHVKDIVNYCKNHLFLNKDVVQQCYIQ